MVNRSPSSVYLWMFSTIRIKILNKNMTPFWGIVFLNEPHLPVIEAREIQGRIESDYPVILGHAD